MILLPAGFLQNRRALSSHLAQELVPCRALLSAASPKGMRQKQAFGQAVQDHTLDAVVPNSRL